MDKIPSLTKAVVDAMISVGGMLRLFRYTPIFRYQIFEVSYHTYYHTIMLARLSLYLTDKKYSLDGFFKGVFGAVPGFLGTGMDVVPNLPKYPVPVFDF